MPRYPVKEKSRVILIGTSDYEHSEQLHRLPAIRNNLTALHSALTDEETGVFASDTCVVADSPDSPKSFMQRLARAAKEAEDTLLVYYAGHGVLGWNDELYLTVRESDDDQIAGTAVPFSWVRSAIQDSPAAVRIIVLDCCFSGAAIGAMSSASAALNLVKVEGTTILTSSSAKQISHSVPGEKYTAFTAELIRLLTEDAGQQLCLGDVYRPLSAAMAKRSLPKPKIVISETAGDLVLRRSVPPPPSRYGPQAETNTQPVRMPVQPAPLRPPVFIPSTPEPYRTQRTDLDRGAWGDIGRITAVCTLGVLALFVGAAAVIGIVQTSEGNVSGGLGPAIGAILVITAFAGMFGFLFVLLLRRFIARVKRRREPSSRRPSNSLARG